MYFMDSCLILTQINNAVFATAAGHHWLGPAESYLASFFAHLLQNEHDKNFQTFDCKRYLWVSFLEMN